jgi:hypothetical protein
MTTHDPTVQETLNIVSLLPPRGGVMATHVFPPSVDFKMKFPST